MGVKNPGPPPPREPTEGDYLQPIKCTGEPEFASIHRNRSGFDAQEIDYGYRSPPRTWGDYDRKELATTALLLYETIMDDMKTPGNAAVVERVKKAWEAALETEK